MCQGQGREVSRHAKSQAQTFAEEGLVQRLDFGSSRHTHTLKTTVLVRRSKTEPCAAQNLVLSAKHELSATLEQMRRSCAGVAEPRTCVHSSETIVASIDVAGLV